MLTSAEGETWAQKFYVIGDAYVVNEPIILEERLPRLLGTILNPTERPADFAVILEKYNYDTSDYNLWNELMQLPVQGEVNGKRVTLHDLLYEKISNNEISDRYWAYEGQGTAITANLDWHIQELGLTTWSGLIKYLAELFQGESGTPPSTPVIVPVHVPAPEVLDYASIVQNPLLVPQQNAPTMQWIDGYAGLGSQNNPFIVE